MSEVVWYSVDDDQRFSLEISFHVDVTRPIEQRSVAQNCADDYHNNHDGWESSWPLKLTLYETETSEALATFNVEREYEPTFYAARITTTQQGAGEASR